MVVVKITAQLKLILPANRQPLHDAELLKHHDSAVDACSVDAGLTGLYQLLHGLGFLVLECFKHDQPWLCQAVAMLFQPVFQELKRVAHAAIIKRIATDLQ